MYIPSEHRESSRWLDSVAGNTGSIVKSANPSDLTYKNGLDQTWDKD